MKYKNIASGSSKLPEFFVVFYGKNYVNENYKLEENLNNLQVTYLG